MARQCPNCGEKDLRDSAKFCDNCGFDLTAASDEGATMAMPGSSFGPRMKRLAIVSFATTTLNIR